jgi:hypothetical protein
MEMPEAVISATSDTVTISGTEYFRLRLAQAWALENGFKTGDIDNIEVVIEAPKARTN